MQGKNKRKSRFMHNNEHFEPVFNTAAATQIVFQQPANLDSRNK